MSCEELRTRIESGDESAETREHLRCCADCLEIAITREPATLFTTMGGRDLTPPGGTGQFVSGVMNEVRLRETERTIEKRNEPLRAAWWWSAAAAVFILVTTWIAIRPQLAPDTIAPSHTVATSVERAEDPTTSPSVVHPVIDGYDRAGATIVELPSDSIDDLKIVMIFDESLPQDL